MADPVSENTRWGILRPLDGLLGPSPVTHTHGSDLNELATGYFLNKEQWWNGAARSLFREKARLLKSTESTEAVTVQVERGRAMGMKLRVHLVEKRLRLLNLHWCARGDLTHWVPGASANHPADLILEVRPPTAPSGELGWSEWLGVSCKSRKGAEGSGLKNPGLSLVSGYLGLDLQQTVDAAVACGVREWMLPGTQAERKRYLRAHPAVRLQTIARGDEILVGLRDTILGGFPIWKIKEFLSGVLHNEGTLPKYVRVVGRGTIDKGFSAELIDPYQWNYTGPYRLQAVGRDGVGFLGNGARICLLRVKWESEKLASTVKFSVDEWK
jgi:hypothetical protein